LPSSPKLFGIISLTVGCLLVSLTGNSSNALAADVESAPIPLIFDTDIGNDCDDVLALGMIHALQSRGECELLAVTITKDHEMAASFVDAVNTFYGRDDIPIGVCRGSQTTPEIGKFNPLARKMDGDRLRYPHDLKSGDEAPMAVEVLRRALAQAVDGSVAVVQVGFSTNLANLLKSQADDISPLSGVELVERKVRLLSIMAGAFQKIPEGKGNLATHNEYNVVQDIPSAQYLALHWPTEIVWSGFEIGIALPYPHQSILNDYRYVPHHPLPEAYIAYEPPPHDRPTWDLTSVLISVRPHHHYFDLSPVGRVDVADNGLTTWSDSGNRDRYLSIPKEGGGRIMEALTLLSSQPPGGSTEY
jgi:inosine-uridine nucleoside N-ribohydrolase